MKQLLPILLCVLYCLSCSDNQRGVLELADDLMELHPDSALAVLKRIDAKSTDARSPYFALLYTQAQVKNNIVVTNDSLISVALSAFAHSSDISLRLRAHFYAAFVAYYNKELPKSIQLALKANEIAMQSNSPYWRAKTSELLADIFLDSYNFGRALDYTKIAVKNYREACQVLNLNYSLCDLATYYAKDGQYDRATMLADSMCGVAASQIPIDSLFLNYAQGALISVLIESGNYVEADSASREYIVPSDHDHEFAAAVRQVYFSAGDSAEVGPSEQILKAYSLAENDKEKIRIMYADFYRAFVNGDYERSAMLSDTLLYLQGKVTETLLQESLLSIELGFKSQQVEFQKAESKELRLTIIFVSIVSALIVILLTLLYKQNLAKKRVELEANIVALVALKSQITSGNARIAESTNLIEMANSELREKQRRITILFREQWNTLNLLSADYFEFVNTEHLQKILFSKIQKEIDKMRKPSTLSNIEKMVDDCFEGIMSDFRQQCSSLSESDKILFLLVVAGFSSRAICLIMDIKYKNFYLRKSRLVKKIESSDAESKSKFLQMMSGISGQ